MKTTTIRLITAAVALVVIVSGVLYLRRPAPTVVENFDDCANCSGAALAAASGESAPAATADSTPAAAVDSAGTTTVAYYFYTTQRCASCLKIESYSHDVIEKEFGPQLQSGRLVWKMVNIDEAGNKHFVDDYKLYTKSLILVDYANGAQVRWKNCQKVWELLNDKREFQAYVKREVRGVLASQ
jgi:hypothetical protein